MLMFYQLFNTNRWYLLSTKLRSEKIAYENLINQGHETFLPTLTIKNKLLAIFPGYIFVKPKKGGSYISIKSTKGVKQFVKFENTFPRVSDDLIEFLKSQICHFEIIAKQKMSYQLTLVKILIMCRY